MNGPLAQYIGNNDFFPILGHWDFFNHAGVSPTAGETVQLDLAMDEAHLFDKQGLAHHASAQGAVA